MPPLICDVDFAPLEGLPPEAEIVLKGNRALEILRLGRVGGLFLVTNRVLLDHERVFLRRRKLYPPEELRIRVPLLRIREYLSLEGVAEPGRAVLPNLPLPKPIVKSKGNICLLSAMYCADRPCPLGVHDPQGKGGAVFPSPPVGI